MMIISLLIAKIGGLIVVFAIEPWLWVVVLAILLSSPAAFWWRIRRVRARRVELQRAEWMVQPDDLPVERQSR